LCEKKLKKTGDSSYRLTSGAIKYVFPILASNLTIHSGEKKAWRLSNYITMAMNNFRGATLLKVITHHLHIPSDKYVTVVAVTDV